MMNQAVTAAIAAQPPPEPARTPESANPNVSPVDPFAGIEDDSLVEGRTLKAMTQNMQQRLQGLEGAAQQLYGQNIGNMELISRSQNQDIWDKYGKEITDEVEKAKATSIVDASTYANAIAIVKGRHIDDFVQAGVQQYMANAPGGDMSAPGGGVPSLSGGGEMLDVPEDWQNMLREAGLSMADVQKSLDKRNDHYGTNITLADYVKQMQNHQIVRDGRQFKTMDLTEGAKKPNV